MDSPRYLEPLTHGPSRRDWSTGLILADTRSAARTLIVLVVLLPLAVCLAAFLPRTPGNTVSIGLLGLLGLIGSIGPVMLLAERRPHRRRLLEQPWRRCPATLAEPDGPADLERVIVVDDGRPLVLRGAMPGLPDMAPVNREVFVVGPDAEGRALVRVAGLCRLYAAKVVTREARPQEPEPVEPEPVEPLRPPEERTLRRLRRGARARSYTVAVGLAGAVVPALGLRPLSVLALVVGGVLLLVAAVAVPIAAGIGRHYAAASAAADAATGWTSLPITLFPWEPTNVVAGLVQLPGGTALVQFPLPNLDVIANIADTGTIWIWGEPSGVVAVGMPRLPVLTFGVLQADRDKPPDEPAPWLLRAGDPALGRIPALRR